MLRKINWNGSIIKTWKDPASQRQINSKKFYNTEGHASWQNSAFFLQTTGTLNYCNYKVGTFIMICCKLTIFIFNTKRMLFYYQALIRVLKKFSSPIWYKELYDDDLEQKFHSDKNSLKIYSTMNSHFENLTNVKNFIS